MNEAAAVLREMDELPAASEEDIQAQIEAAVACNAVTITLHLVMVKLVSVRNAGSRWMRAISFARVAASRYALRNPQHKPS